MDASHMSQSADQRPASPDAAASSNLDSVFDSGYSTGIASLHSSQSISGLFIHQPHESSPSSHKALSVAHDSGLCIPTIDICAESEPSLTTPDQPAEPEVRLTHESYLSDHEGDTKLHLAVVAGLSHLISRLICHVPHPDLLDIPDSFGQTALHLSAGMGQNRVVRQLVVSGATVDVRDHLGNTALHMGCRNGDLDVAKSILKPISPSEVVDAQLKHYKPQVQGCDLLQLVHQMNFAGQTCVHLAASSGNRKLLEYLKVLGANLNVREGIRGWTPLHWAIASSRFDVVQSLIRDCKVDLNVRCYSGQTPLKLAWNITRASRQVPPGTKIMLLLMESGAKPLDQSLYSDDEDSEFFSSEDEED